HSFSSAGRSRHTTWPRDWTSDVCSSDLIGGSSTLSSGTLGGSGDVNFTSSLAWSGGTMSGSGKTIIANTGTLSITTTTHDLNRRSEERRVGKECRSRWERNRGRKNNNGK